MIKSHKAPSTHHEYKFDKSSCNAISAFITHSSLYYVKSVHPQLKFYSKYKKAKFSNKPPVPQGSLPLYIFPVLVIKEYGLILEDNFWLFAKVYIHKIFKSKSFYLMFVAKCKLDNALSFIIFSEELLIAFVFIIK